jgi:hypothetical protein
MNARGMGVMLATSATGKRARQACGYSGTEQIVSANA